MLALALGAGGCATPPVRYYSLAGTMPEASTIPAPAASPARVGNGLPVHIEIAPVGVPERLARPQMLIRNASGTDKAEVGPQVDVLEQQRWASSLDSELRDAFAGAIAYRAGAVDVTRGGGLPGQPAYRIAIRVGHLDPILDRQVDAVFGWTITRSEDTRFAICEVSVSRPAGRGMDALVEAVKQTVAIAAEQIASQIAQLEAGTTAACESGANAGARMNAIPSSGRPGQEPVAPAATAGSGPGAVAPGASNVRARAPAKRNSAASRRTRAAR